MRLGAVWGVYVALSVLLSSKAFALSPTEMSEEAKRSKIQQLYEKQIPLLEQYIRKYPNHERAAQSMFRLGEAYFESAKFAQINNQESRAALYTKKAIEVLEKLRVTHPYYERVDEALLVLASTYLDQGSNEKAGSVLAEIADRFPNSPIMEQASYLLGDHYFSKRLFTQAKRFYRQTVKNEKFKAYGYYKLAWVAIQEEQPGVALKNFQAVLESTQEQKASAFDYSRDAAQEMVWPALEVYGPSKIIPFLEKTIERPKLLKLSISSLANGLLDKGEYSIASKAYDYLLTRFPNDSLSETWIAGQLESEEKLGRANKIVDLVAKLSGQNASSKALRTKIYSSAKKYHAEAQAEKNQTRKAQLYDQAIAYYQAFTQLNVEGPKAYEMQFYFGEALYARDRLPEAAAAYEIAAKNDNEKQVDAAWNWYLTTEKLAPGFKYNGKAQKGTTANDEKFLEAARFVASFDKISLAKRRTASYQSARLIYQLNNFERALPIFQQLAENFPASKEGKLSADLVLDIYNLRKDYQSVAAYARKFQENSDSSSKSELRVLEQKAVFKQIQQEEAEVEKLPKETRANDLNRVASRYIGFARQYPNSSLVDAAIWAAIQLQATAASQLDDRSFSDLRASFNLLVQKYPRSKFVNEAVKVMGEFLAYIQPDEAMLSAYSNYRGAWLKLMRSQPAAKRGPLGMLVYKMSNEAQKMQLEKEFARLPVNPDNRRPIALAKIREIRKHKKAFESISLASAKTLKKNTQLKVKKLENLQKEITTFVKLGEPQLAVDSLYMLSDAYRHMGDALRASPIPAVLKEQADIQKYKAAIAEKAASYDQKAFEAKALAEKTATELGVTG